MTRALGVQAACELYHEAIQALELEGKAGQSGNLHRQATGHPHYPPMHTMWLADDLREERGCRCFAVVGADGPVVCFAVATPL